MSHLAPPGVIPSRTGTRRCCERRNLWAGGGWKHFRQDPQQAGTEVGAGSTLFSLWRVDSRYGLKLQALELVVLDDLAKNVVHQ